MIRRLLSAGVACAALAACADGAPNPTGARAASPARYYAAGIATLRAFGHTQTVPLAAQGTVDAPGVLAPAQSNAPRLPLFVVRDDSRSVAQPGERSREVAFTDQEGHAHRIVSLFGAAGGPASEVQHYVDGTLTHSTTSIWEHRGAVWLQKSARFSQLLPGMPPLETTFSSDTLRLGSAAPARRGALPFVLGLARLLTPPAAAQVIPGACLDLYFKYLNAISISIAAARALEIAVASGNPSAIAAAGAIYAIAVANLIYAEWLYLQCINLGTDGGKDQGKVIQQPTNITLPQSPLAPAS